ncbi:hypothetical protein B9Z55_006785 [Caenorhabditis nigoni]|uniref:Uncharacterized protein n=1 Tax=Caenorhabditis nigoni TaxID=1611254 RepID=A0A2G5V6S2_9PELO|nr:hypothetical protein B9Z55_006785 [Caenorhabditis nigoni]
MTVRKGEGGTKSRGRSSKRFENMSRRVSRRGYSPRFPHSLATVSTSLFFLLRGALIEFLRSLHLHSLPKSY